MFVVQMQIRMTMGTGFASCWLQKNMRRDTLGASA
jgi:hypothetical protein